MVGVEVAPRILNRVIRGRWVDAWALYFRYALNMSMCGSQRLVCIPTALSRLACLTYCAGT